MDKINIQAYGRLFFLLLIIWGKWLCAQDHILHAEYYSIEDGLSHRDVQSVHQDDQGFIWLGTRYGLNRFDGNDFKWFTEEKNGLQSNEINHILADGTGWMWLFNTGGKQFSKPFSIDLFNPLTEEVISFEEKFGSDFPFDLMDISSFSASEEGHVALIINYELLVVYTPGKGFISTELEVKPFSVKCFSKHNTLWGYSSKKDLEVNDVMVEMAMNGEVLHQYDAGYPFQIYYIGGVDTSDKLWYILKYADYRFQDNEKGQLWQVDAVGENIEWPLDKTTLPLANIDLNKSLLTNEYRFWISPKQASFWLRGWNSFQGFHPSSGWSAELTSDFKWLANQQTTFFDNNDRIWVGTDFGVYVFELTASPFQKIQSKDTNNSDFFWNARYNTRWKRHLLGSH